MNPEHATQLYPIARDAASAPFFDATANGRLLIRRSPATGEYLHPSAQTDACGNTELEWVEACGRGTIESWAAVHRKPDTDGATHPIVIAVVELAEGPWLRTTIVCAAPSDVDTGMPVTVEFVQPEGGEALPVFALSTPTNGAQP